MKNMEKRTQIVKWIDELNKNEYKKTGYSSEIIYEHSGTDIISRRQISKTLREMEEEELIIMSQTLKDGRITTYRLNEENDEIYNYLKRKR